MGVSIKLLPFFILHSPQGSNDILELPTVELSSDGTNSPYISNITCSVQGTPPDLAQAIKASYRDFHTNTPVKLGDKPQRLRQDNCIWVQPLPSDCDLTLQINVQYYDSDQNSDKPILSVPKNIAASCHLIPSTSPQEPQTSSNRIVNSSSRTPSLDIKSKQESYSPNPTNLVQEFPGWLSIDFGTSNSTVTLFDTRKVPSPKTLPKEQEERLRERLAQWLNLSAADALPDVDSDTWENFRNDVKFSSDRLLLSIRQIELALASQPTSFRRSAHKKLNQIYHEVFRVPPLEWQSLIPVKLDPNRKAVEISSELEIINFADPLDIIMGERANQNRKKILAETEDPSSLQVQGRFHHSPKRYLGEERDFVVYIDGQQRKVNAKRLIQAAWSHLIKLVDKYRKDNPGRFAVGRFDRVVVTYPTKASPAVRRDIDLLFHELGISQVQTAYDEAVSVAIFFLWREFGGDLSLGIESFKTRCHRIGYKEWSQNALVVDIGGGTTDIALINLRLKEEDPFEPGEDRGAGGRYYKLTPKLLRSSGHPQLGGELITLRLFRLLKSAIADCLLTAVTENVLHCTDVENLIPGLDDRFLENNCYKRSSLVNALEQEGDTAYHDALNASEKVLPTRWEGVIQYSARRMQTFYTLWQYAEEAKLYFSQRVKRDDSSTVTFELGEKEISDLLRQIYSEFQVHQADMIRIQLNSKQFEWAITPVIREAIGIAKGLVVTELGEQAQSSTDSNPASRRVDWLILSGKTCNLHLVEREIYQEFSDYEHFVWNPERVTFVPEFTKLATSAGACYAERLRQYGFNLEESKRILREGGNQLDIDVKNLFYFLPCSFKLKTPDKELLEIFEAGEKLQQLDTHANEPMLKLRTKEWRKGIQLFTTIYRQDYKNGDLMLWGNFNGNKLARTLGMTEADFRNLKVQFEIDQKLRFKLLLCKGEPNYWIAANTPSLNVRHAVEASSASPYSESYFADGKLTIDIAVHVLESNGAHRSNAYHVVFKAGEDYTQSLKTFRYEIGTVEQEIAGVISHEPLPAFPRTNKHTFYFRYPNAEEWTSIGELSGLNSNSEFPCEYYATLDERGELRIHPGEVPYWSAQTEEGLRNEGCVFITELEVQPSDIDKERDPFCGVH